MNKHLLNIEEIFSDPNLKIYHSLGIIDEIALRNYMINVEYKQLRKTLTQIESIFLLSQKYHLAYGSVNSILFRKRYTKSLPLFRSL